jgi:putative ABC transport system permease protein
MLKNYLLITYRNLLKNKIFSLVNILGLAIGMAACFFIFAYVHFESSYDRFHKNSANIYRVNISFGGSFGGFPPMSTNHPATGPAMKKDFPEVKEFARLAPPTLFLPTTSITYTDDKGEEVTLNQDKMFFADPSFLKMFSFPFVKGNPATALNDGNSMVISASMAEKYFGKTDPIGKTLTLNHRQPLLVTGVFRDVPENSHLKFDMLISFVALGDQFGYNQWGWPEFYTYVQLALGADPQKIEARFPAFVEHYLADKERELNFRTYLHLQPLGDIHLRSGETKGAEPNGSEKEVYFLTLIGVLILVIAWINYINLSTAKSVERAKEVGLRKVVGGLRRQIIGQFIFESVLVNLVALGIAVLIVLVCFPFFGPFIGKAIDQGTASSGIWHAPSFWLATLSVYMVSALLVGAYPAFILSSFRPVAVLKGKFGNSTKGIFLRKSLVVVQFVLSLLLIAGSITVYSQLSFMRHNSLGYDKDQILVVKAPAFTDSTFGEKMKVFQASLQQDPSIGGMAPSSDIPGKTVVDRNGMRQASQDKTHNQLTFLSQVDDHFLSTYGMTLAAGRNLNRSDTVNPFTDHPGKIRVLVNEKVVAALGYATNEAAINQNIIFSYGPGEMQGQIVGVVRNYHQRSLKEDYDPMLYWYPAYDNWRYFSLQVKAEHLPQTLARIESVYKDLFTGNPYEYFFLNEYFGRQYQSDERFGKVFGLFTALAIFVACLGLLGLSAFMIRLRTKETGIRKVLGASIYSLLVLFSKDFVRLVAVATIIAVPLVYWGASQWLRNYAFHIRLGWLVFAGPPLLLLAISLAMIGVQSMKTALANPVDSLKTE